MSLTNEDLDQVRDVVIEAIQAVVMPPLESLTSDMAEVKADVKVLKEDVAELKEDVRVLKEDVRVLKSDMREVKEDQNRLAGLAEALEADIKELYALVRSAQNPSYADKQFAKLPFEQKVLQMYEDVKLLAQEAGVTLPN